MPGYCRFRQVLLAGIVPGWLGKGNHHGPFSNRYHRPHGRNLPRKRRLAAPRLRYDRPHRQGKPDAAVRRAVGHLGARPARLSGGTGGRREAPISVGALSSVETEDKYAAVCDDLA